MQGAAGGEGSSVTLQTVIREGESIIHGKGGLMYHGDRQTDTAVSDSQPAASYPLASARHRARQSEHTTHERSRGNKRRVKGKVRSGGGERDLVEQQGPQTKYVKRLI